MPNIAFLLAYGVVYVALSYIPFRGGLLLTHSLTAAWIGSIIEIPIGLSAYARIFESCKHRSRGSVR